LCAFTFGDVRNCLLTELGRESGAFSAERKAYVGLQRAIKGFFSGLRRGMQRHPTQGDERNPRPPASKSIPEGISQAEFRSWLEPGKTIERGLSAKLEAERIRHEMEAQQEYKMQRAVEAKREPLLWFFKAAGVLLGLVLLAGVGVLLFWALLSGVRWLWEHPLW
jgi:hypothetical protein